MAHFHQLICVLLIFKLHFSSEAADCLEDEFENEQGRCVSCKQCGAGYELSEDCGSGRETRCLPCRPGRYKEDQGHYHCLRCLNCAVINRSFKANCSLTSNSICGDCLPSTPIVGELIFLPSCFPASWSAIYPDTFSLSCAERAFLETAPPDYWAGSTCGNHILHLLELCPKQHNPNRFYSKTRIGGFYELECFPCTAHTPRTESQCYPKSESGQPTSTTSPRDPVLLVAIIMVALSLILITLVTFSVICCGHFLKSQFHRAFRRSQNFSGQLDRLDEGREECTQSPLEEQQIPTCCFGTTDISGQVQGQLKELNVISKSNTSNSCIISTVLCSRPPSLEIYAIPPPAVKSHYFHSVSETQSLIRNSGCSDCFSGCGASAESNQGVVKPLPAQTHSCSSDKQHWSHAPVECTELDLENFSSEDPHQAHSRINKSHQTCSCITPATSSTSAQDEVYLSQKFQSLCFC